MGVCFLVTTVVVVLAALLLHFVKPKISKNDTVAEGPMCKAPVELAACNAETEKYPFYHDPDQNSCLVRWQVDAGCLAGGNRFGTASECSKRCIKSTASAASAGEGRGLPAECLEPLKASPCTEDELKKRDHPFFFEDGNCSRQTGPKCLYGPNRFDSEEECREACIATGEPACRVPRFQGACRLDQKRFAFYYDHSLAACVAWRTACLDGPNRHTSLATCSRTCQPNLLEKLLAGF
ncbi:papilin-like [Amblyomma americanum]